MSAEIFGALYLNFNICACFRLASKSLLIIFLTQLVLCQKTGKHLLNITSPSTEPIYKQLVTGIPEQLFQKDFRSINRKITMRESCCKYSCRS